MTNKIEKEKIKKSSTSQIESETDEEKIKKELPLFLHGKKIIKK